MLSEDASVFQIDSDLIDNNFLEKIGEAYNRRLQKLYAKGCDGNCYQPINEEPYRDLMVFYLHLTFNCPLRCSFCYADGGVRKSAELTAVQHYEILQDAVRAGFRKLVITGGEPLVYKEFDRLLNLLYKFEHKDISLVLRSSLSFPIPQERLAKIAAVFDSVVVSIDGTEERHDSIRGAGRFAQAMDNINRLQSCKGCRLELASVMEKPLYEGEQGRFIKELAAKLNASRITINAPKPLGRGMNMDVEYFVWKWPSKGFGLPRMRFGCGLGHNLYVEPDGNVYPCNAVCTSEHLLGNLTQVKLQDILENGKLLIYSNMGVDTNAKCKNCHVRYLCGGMCKAYFKDKDNPDSGDFYCYRKKNLLEKLLAHGVKLCEEDLYLFK